MPYASNEKAMAEKEEDIWVPQILKIGRRGVNAKIWTFLYVNQGRWFTAKEISKHLDMPQSTVQSALKQILPKSPRVISLDIKRDGRGRPEKKYSFQRLLQ